MTHIDTYSQNTTQIDTITHKYTHSTHIYTQIATSLGGSQKITRIYIYLYIYTTKSTLHIDSNNITHITPPTPHTIKEKKILQSKNKTNK